LTTKTTTSINISSEEAVVLLTCLEYYLVYVLERKEKHDKGLLQEYDAIPQTMIQMLNKLKPKLVAAVNTSR
jgi:adenosyl cobinamide kinase/adenosyl cobinamide phosphate guanylyltransferase